jgi:ankyrin repeat protein
LDAAVSQGDNETVKLLLEHHADPNATFGTGSERNATPLMMAAWSKWKEIAKTLLDNKADPNLKNLRGETAAWKAFNINDPDMLALLLENKADTEIKFLDGRTLLHLAALYGREDYAQLLLAHAANPNARDDYGKTPLHLAVERDSRPLVDLLLAHGADVNAKDKDGDTPLDLRAKHSNSGPGYVPAPPLPFRPVGNTPLSYQWQNNGTPGDAAKNDDLSELLLQHGGIAEVDVATVRVIRSGKFTPYVIFHKDTGGYDHFTLYELLLNVYVSRTHGNMNEWPVSGLTFPDFSRLKIIHLPANGRTNIETIDLEKALAEGDCSKDISLKWGDIVDIPEADHKVSSVYGGLAQSTRDTLNKCLTRDIKILVKGQVTEVRLKPAMVHTADSPKVELSLFRLSDVVRNANVLLASSDLTKVKVKRVEPGGKKNLDMVFNLEKMAPNSDLWLENGDVIEIPEKSAE